jgi:hypothetical protein
VRDKPRQDFAERVDDAAAVPCGEFDRGQIVHLPLNHLGEAQSLVNDGSLVGPPNGLPGGQQGLIDLQRLAFSFFLQ